MKSRISPSTLLEQNRNWPAAAKRLTWAATPSDIDGTASWAEQRGIPPYRLLSEIWRLPASILGEVVLRTDTAEIFEFADANIDGRKIYKAIIVPVRDLNGEEIDRAAIIPDRKSVHLYRGAVGILGEHLLAKPKRSAPLRVFRCPFAYWRSNQQGIVILNSTAAGLLRLACRAGLQLLAEDEDHKQAIEKSLAFNADLHSHVRVRAKRNRTRGAR